MVLMVRYVATTECAVCRTQCSAVSLLLFLFLMHIRSVLVLFARYFALPLFDCRQQQQHPHICGILHLMIICLLNYPAENESEEKIDLNTSHTIWIGRGVMRLN